MYTIWRILKNIKLNKKFKTQEYILYDSIFIKFWNKENYSMVEEIRMVDASGDKEDCLERDMR